MLRSVRGKLLVSMIAIAAGAVLLITVIFYLRSASMIQENYTENLYARVKQSGDGFDDSMSEIYHLNISAACDEELLYGVKRYLEKETEEEMLKLSELLHKYAARCSDISFLYLVIPDKGTIVTSREYPLYKKEVESGILNDIAGSGRVSMRPVLMEDPLRTDSAVFSFVSPVTDEEGAVFAYVMSNVQERSLYYRYLDRLEDEKNRTALLVDEENRIISGKDTGMVGSIYMGESDTTRKEEHGKGIEISHYTSFADFRILAVSEKSEVLADLRKMRIFLMSILLAAIGLAMLLALKISRAIYQPIKTLTETVEQVSHGDLECRTESSGGDEIGRLSEEFNHMLDQIQELIAKVIEEERLKKDAELESLQYQITPHFMYNTLNSIKYAALLKGEERIGGMIEDFIELLQASISKKGMFVTLAEEVHLVENYMRLQSMRYEEEIMVSYQIPEEVQGCFVPRLMLQPLVENAILHGLELKNGKNQITIGSEVQEGILILWVSDNGRGMTGAQIKELLSQKGKKTSGLSGIGVSNVKERLALYYGEEGKLTYESGRMGTKAEIRLPACSEPDSYCREM